MLDVALKSDDAAELTPREIVAQLDRHIVGQAEAKRGRRDRHAKPLAATTASGRNAAGSLTQKHPDDWPHRRWQN